MKVAVFSTKHYERAYLSKYNTSQKHALTFFDVSLNTDTADLAVGFDAVCLLLTDKINAAVAVKLAAAHIRLIVLRSAGFDNVDIEAAGRLGIKVLNIPGYSPQAIAEHAVALMLTLDRKTHKAYNRVRENNFSLENLMGFNLFGKTVGVVGTGEIGTAFCNIMIGFGCKIIAYDIAPSELLVQKGIKYVSFDKLLEDSAIISIHCPLTTQTHHLFNSKTFSGIKKGCMLINTGRGGIINTAHAIEALKNGQLGYLGIDVYEGEENLFFKDLSETVVQDGLIERLMSFNNVLITPHLGFFTEEAVTQIAIQTIENITDFENGGVLINEVKLSDQTLVH